jgi:ATP-binding protein involved in chromosome partitioning
MNVEQVVQALRQVVDPTSGHDIVRLGMVKGLVVEGRTVLFTLVLKDPAGALAREAQARCTAILRQHLGEDLQVEVSLDNEMIGLGGDLLIQGGGKAPAQIDLGVHNTIAVASGKGGVGKSTVAVNLAVALARQGYDVGLVDTDIYGPSIPTMFGLQDMRPEVNAQRKIVPLRKHGVKLLSMGFLVDPEKAVIWRGPMVSGAIRQFLGEADWGALDFLILDLPPGTGDIQLTIVQSVALSGAIIVSTPQEVALADARKGVAMFQQVNVPILGIVENMAYFTPPDLPDRRYYLFGKDGAYRLSKELKVPFLGAVPIEQAVREGSDDGRPIVLGQPATASAQAFFQIAETAARQVYLRNALLPPTQKVEILYR